jgi:hypothetical protein
MDSFGLSSKVMTCVLAVSTANSVCAQPREPEPWAIAMRETHARFSGKPGTLALFGDSITVSLAFWAPLSSSPRGLSPELESDLKLVNSHIDPACWREWRGREFGNEGGMTIRWADENVDAWLKKLNPETAVILFGTNDLTAVGKDEYEEKLRRVVQHCLANGTVVVLTTLPPRHGLDERSAEFAESVRTVSRDLMVPLVDYHAEILKRRPQDWDGALELFREAPGDEYNVPTLIARDGVHPSNPRDLQDYSERSLSHNGYALRSALTLSRYAEVIRKVLRREG